MCLNPIKVHYKIKFDGTYDLDWSNINKYPRVMELPCGNCIECDIKRTREWATRIMIEAKSHTDNCVLTLTYDNNHCPDELVKRDIQLFLKRLFKKEGLVGVRRFYCGEYGSLKGRPHFHCILFGYKPKDLVYFFGTGTDVLYKSKTIENIWGKGYITVGLLTYRSAFYCSKYLQKQIKSHYEGKVPPFIEMSRRPGIGYNGSFDIKTDMGKIFVNGKYLPIPRYFDKVNMKDPSVDYLIMKIRRQLNKHYYTLTERRRFIHSKINFYSKFTNKFYQMY